MASSGPIIPPAPHCKLNAAVHIIQCALLVNKHVSDVGEQEKETSGSGCAARVLAMRSIGRAEWMLGVGRRKSGGN